jgi:hypothetical protein
VPLRGKNLSFGNGLSTEAGSGDSIDSAQFTYTVSRVESRDAVNTSVPVGRLRAFSSLQHPTQPIPGKPTIASSMGKAKSPGNAENFGYTDVLEPRQNVFYDGGRRCFLYWG